MLPDRTSRWLVLGGFVVYALGFIAYWPSVLLVVDESSYVRQAHAFAEGTTTIVIKDPWTGQEKRVSPSTYPPGTSALQAIFVRIGGWRAAAVASVLSLFIVLLVLTKWLKEEGRSPFWAILFLAYPAVLCQARVAMSDLPSAAIVTVGLWAFWRGQNRSWGHWFLSGTLAGVSVLFRETNALVFVPFYLGAVLRRQKKALALVCGGLVGLGVRLVVSRFVYGSLFFIKVPNAFSVQEISNNLGIYLIALLLMAPGGLIAVGFYRGPRRAELIATVLLTLSFFLIYGYSGEQSGALKRLVLGPRFLIPLLPVIVIALADVAPRLWRRITAGGTPSLDQFITPVACVTALAVYLEGCATHWYLGRWSANQRAIVEAIYANTSERAAIVDDALSTSKFINELYGRRIAVDYRTMNPGDLPRLLKVHGAVQLALLYRQDSEFWKQHSVAKDQFVASAAALCKLDPILDQTFTATDRLKIWNVRSCGAPAPAANEAE